MGEKDQNGKQSNTSVEWTAERAAQFDIEGQRKGESNNAFRGRVSAILRQQGHIIEAHEARQNALYDDQNNPLTEMGIKGAVAQEMQGKYYTTNPAEQVGDDIAAGGFVSTPERETDPTTAILTCLLFGKR